MSLPALLLVLAPGTLAQYTVTQDRSQAPAHEGEPIQLNCSYTGTEYSVHWYRQPQGGQPRFVASLSSSRRDTRENFTMSLDIKTKSSFLYLNSSRLEDSAVYLCAMEHRARSNTFRLNHVQFVKLRLSPGGSSLALHCKGTSSQTPTPASLGITSFGLPRPVFPTGPEAHTLSFGGSCQAEVHQNLSAVTREGQNSSITCHYTTSDFRSLQWFRQLPGGQPVSLLILASDGKQTKEPNLTTELDKGKQLSSLHIRESQLGDAATYFCAVETQRVGWETYNHTVVTHFVLLGIPNASGLQTILFITFLAFYLCTLLGNLLILLAILADPRLHTPMYFFLCNLSVLDIGFSSISTPKFLANLWAKNRTISLGGCMSQVFFYHFLGSTECLLYTAMAYDRYVAICHPLRYLLIMNRRVCALLAAGTWLTSSFHATILTSLTFTLPYCGSNVVDYFFCDIFPVIKLACADTYIIETVTFTDTGMVPTTCFLLILASYVRIVYSVLKINSAEGRRKAASTCASHLAVVTLFFGPCALVYTQPQLSKVLVTPVQIFGNVVTPMLNPAIYTLRNKEVKAALRKLRGGQTPAR
ncbi:olfactory receptor 10D3-like [Eretmochelys imbricata]